MSTTIKSPWRDKVAKIIKTAQVDAQELHRLVGGPVYLVRYGTEADGYAMVTAVAGNSPVLPAAGCAVRILGHWEGSNLTDLGAWVYDTLWRSEILPDFNLQDPLGEE